MVHQILYSISKYYSTGNRTISNWCRFIYWRSIKLNLVQVRIPTVKFYPKRARDIRDGPRINHLVTFYLEVWPWPFISKHVLDLRTNRTYHSGWMMYFPLISKDISLQKVHGDTPPHFTTNGPHYTRFHRYNTANTVQIRLGSIPGTLVIR